MDWWSDTAESPLERVDKPTQKLATKPYYCDVCARFLGDSKPHNIQEHKRSTRHIKKLQARRNCGAAEAYRELLFPCGTT
jgi:hypothetical protein